MVLGYITIDIVEYLVIKYCSQLWKGNHMIQCVNYGNADLPETLQSDLNCHCLNSVFFSLYHVDKEQRPDSAGQMSESIDAWAGHAALVANWKM